jgi:hypothetical protein
MEAPMNKTPRSATVPQISPDGMWEWNGTHWIPNQAAPGPQQVVQSLPLVQAGQLVPSAPKSSRGFPRWLVIAAAILLFPITVVILIVRSKWSVRTKAITSGAWIVVLIAAGISGQMQPKPQPVAIGSQTVARAPQSSAPSSVAVTPSSVPVSAPAQASTSSYMTTDSGVYGIPLPSDAIETHSGSGVFASNLATIANYVSFYHDYMLRHGWTYEPNFSWTDPAVGPSKGVGYASNQVFCVVGSSPIRTVAIYVGSKDGKVDQGKLTEMFVLDDPGESSCP